jgi:hypothetical protein
MIKVITNSLGSGDWITVRQGENILFEGHRIGPQDLVSIIDSITFESADLVEVTDEQMEEGEY